ncbi:hypothetical protein [Streptomyces netropsis]|uniref:Uncharacterized protein n=1 Tax=Streptomyces netropsis TaxID=55404 RepID=A0A7W7PCG6_STRNE|nr:hypothetical protein [Streptomyces netropsis]MBB4885004.1 hypothetical protein [Streptomyces netropsis]GGR26026.1 hypothetical protein GCM10010219_33500 [Streptomyces netropsis]
MFEIRVICTEPDAPEIAKALNAAFTTSTVRQRTRDGRRVRLYVTADHRPDTTPSTAEEPYADAPPIVAEMADVLTLALRLHQGDRYRPASDGYAPVIDREYRLRKAVLLDRVALSEGEPWAPEVGADAEWVAEEAAVTFTSADHLDGFGAGPMPPEVAYQQGAYREYVRQEYAAWRRHGHDRLWHCTCDEVTEGPCPAHPKPDF